MHLFFHDFDPFDPFDDVDPLDDLHDVHPADDHEPAWPIPHGDHAFDHRCPGCATNLFVMLTEAHLRVLSLDLWVAGWTPDELVEHVRRSVADTRAADLMAHVLLVDDSHRSDHARPPEWRAQVERLRAALGVGPGAADPGWLARWARGASSYESSGDIAEVLHRTVLTLSELVDPMFDAG